MYQQGLPTSSARSSLEVLDTILKYSQPPQDTIHVQINIIFDKKKFSPH
jgi:hypothetical protein